MSNCNLVSVHNFMNNNINTKQSGLFLERRHVANWNRAVPQCSPIYHSRGVCSRRVDADAKGLVAIKRGLTSDNGVATN